MDYFVHYLQQGFLFIVPMIILLGLLIFVHELGHFLVAKYYGVKVEVFSLGFGKKLLQFQRGDTNYCLAMIPLGGYVKMFGDDPTVELPPEQQSAAFLYKPVSQKMAIVLAGPLMNLFFAIFLFAAVAMVGEPAASPTLGDITPRTEAHLAGFRSGDKIVGINGQAIQTWEDVRKTVQKSAEADLEFDVKRILATAAAPEELKIKITPKRVMNQDVLSTEEFVGDIEGLANTSRASVIGILDPTSLAHIAGLRTGDFVSTLNGIDVSRWRDFLSTIEQQIGGRELIFEVSRASQDRKKTENLTITITPSDLNHKNSGSEILKSLGIEYPSLFLSEVVKDSPAEAAGLRQGDKILDINGQPMANWEQVLSTITAYQKDSGPVRITVQRGSAEMAFEVTPRLTTLMNSQGAEIERFAMGIGSAYLVSFPETFEMRTSNPLKAAARGMALSWQWTKAILVGIVRLVQARVSSKNISGVITIGREASNAFQRGLSSFLSIMAIISINLFILNLLPIPILDGGHLVFFSIEALRGAPLSMRKMEIAQQVGLVLLLGLMAFALFNDVTRLLN